MEKLVNMAIVAHVDHGKTTLMDGLIQQSETLGGRESIEERVMDSGELERERGITIKAKNCAIFWKGHKINLIDTPGHADFGGEVERSLLMVDNVVLLVDAAEGPLPQTRFVLAKAMELGVKIAVVINKIDRPDERIEEVKDEIEDLLLDLAASLDIEDFDLEVPFYYASAKEGFAKATMQDDSKDLTPLLDFMISPYFRAPKIKEGPFQLQVTNLSYSTYLGPQIVGRIISGTIYKNQQYQIFGPEEKVSNFKATHIQVFSGLENKDVDEASAGEIIILAGFNDPKIGDTVGVAETERLPRLEVDPPTVSVTVSVNTSPNSGREGEYLTSRKLEELLELNCHHNVALQFKALSDPKEFELKGRGELQLAIVFEEIRRQGYELMAGRPHVVIEQREDGKYEPFESVVLDVPNDDVGLVTERLGQRKGKMTNLRQIGDDRTRIEFDIPARGLIGYRSQFLTDTRGEGIMSSHYLEHRPFAGDMLGRQNGAIIADRAGKATPYALYNLLSSGKQFIRPGEVVYEGQVIGEHTRQNDINVNCIREKHLSSMRTAGKDENIIIPSIQDRTLDWAINWIDDDEWVEITPKQIRVRKKTLEKNKRSTIRR